MITYNHENYIRDAIEGVLMQKTSFPIELVIGEDCSTDNTRAICIEYQQKYPEIIRLLLPEKNLGANKNFINTLAACKGKYIALCEGDDYWTDPYKLQKQVDFLENNPEYGLVYTDYNRLYQKTGTIIKNFLQNKKYVIEDGVIFDKLMNFQNISQVCTVVFRKNIIYEYFDFNAMVERKWQLGDLPLLLTFAKHSKIKYLNESTATYRVLEESASNTKNYEKKHELHKSIYDVFLFYADKYNCSEQIKQNIKIKQYQAFLKDALFLKNKKLSAEAKAELQQLNVSLSFKENIFWICTQIGFLNKIVLLLYKLYRKYLS